MTHPYASPAYAAAFGAGYEPVFLPSAQSFVLKRLIPGTEYYDAMGCYPLASFSPQADLAADFELLAAQGVVSLVAVADPFYFPSPERAARQFDRFTPFKEHYLHDFSRDRAYSKHHRYEVRRARRDNEVARIRLADHLEEWCALYDTLVARHGMRGISAFSRDYFKALAAMEPLMIGAFHHGALTTAHLWLVHDGVAYSHLGASNEEGYQRRTPYAVYDFSLEQLAQEGVRLVNLGGGAGVEEASKGLTFFKQGFSNATVMCHLAGKILRPDIYANLSEGKREDFFPAYRG